MAESGVNIQEDKRSNNGEDTSNKNTSNKSRAMNRAMTLEGGINARAPSNISDAEKKPIGTKSRSRGQGKRTMTIDSSVRANSRRNQFAKKNQPALASVKETLDERVHDNRKVNETDKGTSTLPEDEVDLKGADSLQRTPSPMTPDKTASATENRQPPEANDKAQLNDSYTEPSTTSHTKSSVIPHGKSSVTSVTKSSVTNGESIAEVSDRRSSMTSETRPFASQTSLTSDRKSSVTSITKPLAIEDDKSAETSGRRSSTTSDTKRSESQVSVSSNRKSSVTSDTKPPATKGERSAEASDRRSSTTSNKKPEDSEKSERRSSVSSVRSGRSSVASNRKSSVSSNKRTSVSYGANESGTDSRKSSVTSTRRDSRATSNNWIGNGGREVSNKAGSKNWRDAFTKSNHAFSPKQGRRQSEVGNSVESTELSERDRKREAEMIFWRLDMEDIMLRLRRVNKSLDAHLKRLSARETTALA